MWFYWLIIRLISPFHEKARKFADGRKNWRKDLSSKFKDNTRPVVWFHAASLGEFEQGRPVIEALKKDKPHIAILLTFFSPSGYEIRKNYEHADWVVYLPIDTPRNARFFIETVKPSAAVFIKYEYWYFFLKYLHLSNTPILMVSAIFRENQLFFHRFGGFYRKALRWINYYFVQDEHSDELIKSIGITESVISGDTRFDRVLAIAEEAQPYEIVEHFKQSETAMVLGSVWSSDLDIIESFIKENQQDIKFIIAPHNVNEEEIAMVESRFDSTIRFSEATTLTVEEARILIIDNIGMLSSLYRYGEYAFIGGAFRGALHNTLEAAVYGIPIFFGEHASNEKFKEAIDLTAAGGAFTFETVEQLNEKFDELLEVEAYTQASRSAGKFVRSNAGATGKVVDQLNQLLE